MRIALLTCGGDCPGLNAVIRAVVRTAAQSFGYEVIGFRNGWKGVANGDKVPLPLQSVSGIIYRGGTILGTSRYNPKSDVATQDKIVAQLKKNHIDALIVVGGDGTMLSCHMFAEYGLKIVGIPKTIDNDISGTDVSFGFHTAVQIVTDALDRLHTTAESHHRVMVVEVMGRNSGWIALMSGLAGGADMILIPEKPFTYEDICNQLIQRHKVKDSSIVVVAEGAKPIGGQETFSGKTDEMGRPSLGGVGYLIGNEIENRTGIETRVTVLGHVQRGGTPVAYDRILATRFGVRAVEAVAAGEFDKFVALQGEKLVMVPISEHAGKSKFADLEIYKTAEIFYD